MARTTALAIVLAILSGLAMSDAARFGWGAATIEGDRVKWGLRSMGRSPLQPIIVVKDFCWWREGARGLCTLVPGSGWAATFFRWASPLAWVAAAGYFLCAGLFSFQRRLSRRAILLTSFFTLLLGVTAIAASHRIAIFREHGVDPGSNGSLTWRVAILLSTIALVLPPPDRK